MTTGLLWISVPGLRHPALDAGSRRWIPAFAGMTKVRRNDERIDMRYFIFGLLLFICVILEAYFYRIPFLFNLIFLFYVLFDDDILFFYGFIMGIILDILTLNIIGTTSAFIIISLFIIRAYEKKFEIKTKFFVLFFSFLGSIFYFLLFGNQDIFLKSLFNSLVVVGLYLAIGRFLVKQNLKDLNSLS